MPTKQPSYVDATFYVQMTPEFSRFFSDTAGNKILEGAKFARATIKAPERQQSGTVLLKLTVSLPAGAFLPLAPEAVVVIPEGMTMTAPVQVVASDPNDDYEMETADA